MHEKITQGARLVAHGLPWLLSALLMCPDAHAENGGRWRKPEARPARTAPSSPFSTLGSPPALLRAPAPCPAADPAWTGWIGWRDERIATLLALQPPSRKNLDRGVPEPFVAQEPVLKEARNIVEALDACEQAGIAVPGDVRNLRDFARTQHNASFLDRPDKKPPPHQFGYGVPDTEYLEKVKDRVTLPCLLRSQDFLKALAHPRDYRRAWLMIQRQNKGETVNGCAAERGQWQVLLYRSQFLGTPDDADTLGRFLIVVPAADPLTGYEQWIQFGIWNPQDRTRQGQLIQNVSVVAVGGRNAPGADAIVDWYRCRDAGCTTRTRGGPIDLRFRRLVTDTTGNCQECHKSMPLSIHPSRVYRPDGSAMPQAAASAAVAALNERIDSSFKRQPRWYSAGPGDEMASPKRYGPVYGANPAREYPKLGEDAQRTLEWVAACSAGLPLDAGSLRAVRDAMICGDCHSHGDKKFGALNFPQGTEKRTSRKYAYNEKDKKNVLDVVPNLVRTYILDGTMPPPDELGGKPLKDVERKALYRCLSDEYFKPAPVGSKAMPSGLFVDWLRQQDVEPETMLAATGQGGPVLAASAVVPPSVRAAGPRARPGAHAAFAATAADSAAPPLKPCERCHQTAASTPPPPRPQGPTLLGVFGRVAASTGYTDHSEELLQLGRNGLQWDEASLMEFLRNPDAFLRARTTAQAESTMTKSYPAEDERRRIVDVLRTLR